MKRQKIAPHENHERWLVSYADFITLLFAFFVVMFASTQSDKSKAKAVSESVREALEHGQMSTAISMVLGRGKQTAVLAPGGQPPANSPSALTPVAHPSPPADLGKSLETLRQGLELELKSGKVQLKLEDRGLVVSLRESAFFASGEAAVAPAGFPIVEKIAAVVQALENPVRLEGHTDSVPIHNSRFRNNWELSAARSIAMLELLRDRFQIPTGRMAVAGYAENAPADTNETEEGRAHNRRVDLVVLSEGARNGEPNPHLAGAPSAGGSHTGQ